MLKLTDTQSIILNRAACRPGNLAMPLPHGLAGAAAKMTVSKMIERGWLEEVPANLSFGDPLWRETGNGQGTTLIATEAGLEAIEIEPIAASTISRIRKAATQINPNTSPPKLDAVPTPRLAPIRQGTKQAMLIEMLERPEGASIAEIVEVTSWQAHTARSMISRALKKKLGLRVSSEKQAGRGTVHKLDAGAI